jgi:hypothetical protein
MPHSIACRHWLRFFDGYVIVHPSAQNISGIAFGELALRRQLRRSAGEIGVVRHRTAGLTEIIVKILALDAPIIAESPFGAAASRPAELER